MKYMLFKLMWVVVMVGVLFCLGCKKVDESIISMLCYKWEWVQSSGGIYYHVRTPESEGYTQALEFEENGTYTIYRNNAVFRIGTYTINRAVSSWDGKEYDVIVFDSWTPNKEIRLITEKDLILQDIGSDVFTNIYQR